METIGLRYFNVFGKNQDPNGAYAAAIPKFIQLLRDKMQPTVFGDGGQTRDFTYIENVLKANECALRSSNQNAFGETFNVACGESYSLNLVIDTIKSSLIENGLNVSAIEANYEAPRKGDIRDSLASIEKISDLLDYRVQKSFTEGMKEYVSWILNN